MTMGIQASAIRTTAPVKGSNFQKQRDAAFKTADELGKQAGKGDLAVSQAFMNVVKFADEKLFVPEDAKEYASRLANARASAGLGEAKTQSIKKNASYFSQGISAAALPNVEFRRSCEKLYVTFSDMRKAGKAVKPLIEAYTAAARIQLQHKTEPLSQEEIDECCKPFVKGKKSKTRVEFWVKLAKTIEKIIDDLDDGSDTPIIEDGEEANPVENVLHAVRDRIRALPADELNDYKGSFSTRKRKASPIGNSQPQAPTTTEPPAPADEAEDDDKSEQVEQAKQPEQTKKPKPPKLVKSPLGPPNLSVDDTLNKLKDVLSEEVGDDGDDGDKPISASLLHDLRKLGII